MSEVRDKKIDIKWIGVVAVLFGILLFANHGNELLKQLVITPLSAAELGIPADCRADELEEENISDNFSVIISVLNCNLGITAKIKHSGQGGVLSWNGKDYREVQLNDSSRNN